MACNEYRALLRGGTSCMERFQELLALEGVVPGVPGEMPHFLAVALYALQHPESMGYSRITLEGLRALVADAVSENYRVSRIRRRVRYQMQEGGKVRRAPEEAVPVWPLSGWPITVEDVLEGGAETCVEGVESWARSVAESLSGLALFDGPRPEGAKIPTTPSEAQNGRS